MIPQLIRYGTAFAVGGVFAAAIAGASFGAFGQGPQTDSLAVVRVVDQYHHALSVGDTVAAWILLASDALILESGDVETREEYRSQHLPMDAEFARAVPGVYGAIRVIKQGDAAWAISTSTTQGIYQGRAVDARGAELMVLTKEVHHWKIRVIHWSSRAMRP